MTTTTTLRSNARRFPDRMAVVSGARSWTWHDLEARVARMASVLRARGVRDGDRVAILADNHETYLAAFFAIAWAGAIILPLNLRLSAAELAELIDHGEPAIVLHDDARAALLADAIGRAASPLPVLSIADMEALSDAAEPVADAMRKGEDIASIFFTGGTTGRSKGAMLTHNNHMFNGLMMWTELDADISRARYLHSPPMFHVADALFVHAITLVAGLHVVIPRFEARAAIDAIERHAITDAYLVPTMITALLDELERNPAALASLERIFYGAMPMPEATARRLMAALPHVGLVQLYGQSEAGPVLTMLLPEDHGLSGATRRLRSAGTPMAGSEIAIHDPEGRECAPGVVGEIVARSGTVMPGYWRAPEQSADTLRDGWLHTGDAGYIDEDGFLYVVDRIKDMIISGGENIYSIEVERAISLHPAVSQCAVIGMPDPRWGERVHAAVVLREGAALDDAGLVAHCRTLIAGYKLPRSIDWRASLPLSGPGKILKRALRDEALAALQSRETIDG